MAAHVSATTRKKRINRRLVISFTNGIPEGMPYSRITTASLKGCPTTRVYCQDSSRDTSTRPIDKAARVRLSSSAVRDGASCAARRHAERPSEFQDRPQGARQDDEDGTSETSPPSSARFPSPGSTTELRLRPAVRSPGSAGRSHRQPGRTD